MLAGLIAILMSSMSGCSNASATLVVRDFFMRSETGTVRSGSGRHWAQNYRANGIAWRARARETGPINTMRIPVQRQNEVNCKARLSGMPLLIPYSREPITTFKRPTACSPRAFARSTVTM